MRINILFDFYKYYYFWALTMCYSLRKLGIESDVFCPVIDGNHRDLKGYKYPDADYYIVFNDIMAKDYSGESNTNLLAILNNLPDNSKKIWMPSNQIDFDSDDQTIKNRNDYFKRVFEHDVYDYIVTTKRLLRTEFKNNGLNVSDDIIGFGYSDVLDEYIYANKVERDIGVHFCGDTYAFQKMNRREIALQEFKEKSLQVTRDHDIWLVDYYKQLARSKIELNIHGWPKKSLKTNYEYVRTVSSIMQKTLVISEPIMDCYPFVDGEHLVCCEISEMPSVCEYYLNHDDERQEIVNNAFKFWKEHYNMENLLYNFIVNNIDKNFRRKNIEIPKVQL